MATYGMTISGSGIASNGLRQITDTKKAVENAEGWHDTEDLKEDLDLGTAEMAIECLHDALLGVAMGKVTPEQIKDFFWPGEDLEGVKFYNTVLKFDETTPPQPATGEG